MFLLRPCALVACLNLLAIGLCAQEKKTSPDKPESQWAVDRSLTVSPQGEPLPALRYRLLPPESDLRDGNAVPIYLRLIHEQSDADLKQRTDTPQAWNALPIGEIPLPKARQFLQEHRYFARQLELGARRRIAEWNYTLEEPNPIGLLLPDVQMMRTYEPTITLQVRTAIAEQDFAAAAHHLETGFAFSRHVAEGPTLIHGLVAMRLASQFVGAAADFIEQPQSPNLYWALTELPRPLIDLRPGLNFEYRAGELQFPVLGDLDRPRGGQQWEADLQALRQQLRRLDEENGKPQHPEWYPKGTTPGTPAADSPDLAEARSFVGRSKGLPLDEVASLPAAQVLLLYIAGAYREDRDDWHKATYLPYAKADHFFKAAADRLRKAPITEGHILARLLLPALDRVVAKQNLLDRNIAALRVIEALRIYAAAHDGNLPEKLDDITEVPLPEDPGTARPFEYRREENVGILVSQSPDETSNNSLRYRVTIRTR
jgi:hypothetical protein